MLWPLGPSTLCCGAPASHCGAGTLGLGLSSCGSPALEHRLNIYDTEGSAACGIFPGQGWNPCVLHWHVDSNSTTEPLRQPPSGSDGRVGLQCPRPRFNRWVWKIPGRRKCLENPMDWGAWQSTVLGVAKSRTRLSDFTSNSSFLKNIFFLFIYLDVPGLLCRMQVEACDWDPDLGSNQGPLHWEHRVLVTGPPGKSLSQDLPFILWYLRP